MSIESGDREGDKKKLEDTRDVITAYQNHAITTEFEREDKDRQDALLQAICNVDVVDIESFFAHFAAVGALSELRRRSAMLPARLEEIQEKLKEL